MNVYLLLLHDTWANYWHALLFAMTMAQVGVWTERKWIFRSFSCMTLFWIYSESIAIPTANDPDAIYLIGCVMRITIAFGILAIATMTGTLVRRCLCGVTKSFSP